MCACLGIKAFSVQSRNALYIRNAFSYIGYATFTVGELCLPNIDILLGQSKNES